MNTKRKIEILLFAGFGGGLLICAGTSLQRDDILWAIWCFFVACVDFFIAWSKLK